MQVHPNDWFTRHAQHLLQERSEKKEPFDTDAVRFALMGIFQDDANPVNRMRAMWTLSLSRNVDDKWLQKQLHHDDPHVQLWAVRLLVDDRSPRERAEWAPLIGDFKSVARDDQSGLVLLYLAASLQKMPADARWSIGHELARRSETGFCNDRTLSIMLWLGIEPLVAENSAQALDLLVDTKFQLLRENIARRLALEIDRDPSSSVEKLLALAANRADLTAPVLRGIVARRAEWQAKRAGTSGLERYVAHNSLRGRRSIARRDEPTGCHVRRAPELSLSASHD